MAASRNMIRMVSIHEPSLGSDLTSLAHLLSAFFISLKLYLRSATNWTEIEQYLSEDQYAYVKMATNRPVPF